MSSAFQPRPGGAGQRSDRVVAWGPDVTLAAFPGGRVAAASCACFPSTNWLGKKAVAPAVSRSAGHSPGRPPRRSAERTVKPGQGSVHGPARTWRKPCCPPAPPPASARFLQGQVSGGSLGKREWTGCQVTQGSGAAHTCLLLRARQGHAEPCRPSPGERGQRCCPGRQVRHPAQEQTA